MLCRAGLAGMTVAAFAAISAQAPAPADLIVHNATIYTVDPARPIARAIAVRGDRIVAVGEDGAVLRACPAACRGDAAWTVGTVRMTVIAGENVYEQTHR
jgi:hypothetical protein